MSMQHLAGKPVSRRNLVPEGRQSRLARLSEEWQRG